MTARSCPHRETLFGSLATADDRDEWAAELATPCPACAAPVPPAGPMPALPDVVALALAAEGKAGAKRAQAALDALEVGRELYPAIVARLSAQPGTGPFWRRWWAGWRDGALVG